MGSRREAGEDPAGAVMGTLSADTVADSLRELILDGTLGVGLQLRQEELARRFGVSRIPVREALGRLQAEGLVEHFANRGSVVAGRSVEDLLETLDIRIALESRALRLSLPNLTARDFKAAREVFLPQLQPDAEGAIEDQLAQRIGDRVGRKRPHHCTGGIFACFTTRSHFATSAAM